MKLGPSGTDEAQLQVMAEWNKKLVYRPDNEEVSKLIYETSSEVQNTSKTVFIHGLNINRLKLCLCTKDFQKKHDLEVDGLVGKLTKAALKV